MKLKRTKLAAIALSALMVVSGLSPYVYASEDEAAVAAETVVEETTEEAEEAVDEAAVVTDETEEETTAVSDSIVQVRIEDVVYSSSYTNGFLITVVINDGKDDHAFDITAKSGTDANTGYTYTVTYTEPTCTKNGSLVLTLALHGETLTYTAAYGETVTFKSNNSNTSIDLDYFVTDTKALQNLHDAEASVYADTDNGYYVDENGNKVQNSCSHTGSIYLYYPVKCSYCDTTLYWTKDSEPSYGAPHVMTATGVIVASTSGNINISSTSVNAAKKDLVDSEGLKYDTVPEGSYYKATLTNGEPTLKNAQKSGTYYVQYYCSQCQQYVYVEEHIAATEAAYAKIVSTSGIRYFYFYTGDGELIRYTPETIGEVKFSTSLTTGSTAYVNLPDTEDIELITCTVAGSYTIRYYTADGEEITNLGQTKKTVDAHHMTIKVAVFDDQDDLDKVTISYDSEGNLSVKSSVCTPTITYYEVEECYAEGCRATACTSTYELAGAIGSGIVSTVKTISEDEDGNRVVSETYPKSSYTVSTNGALVNGSVDGSYAKRCTYNEISDATEKTATTGSHTWLESVLAKVNEAYNEAIKDGQRVISEETSTYYTDEEEGVVAYSIKGMIEDALSSLQANSKYATYGDYVKITEDTSTCTSSGTVTVTFYCTSEDAGATAVYTKTYAVDAHGHDYDDAPTAEITTEATCTSEGLYVRSWTCNYCGNEKEETVTKTIERLAHTNEIANTATTAAASGNYADDTTNKNHASTIYIEVTGDKVVDYGGSLLSSSAALAHEYVYNEDGDKVEVSNTEIVGTLSHMNLIGGGSEGDATLGVTVRVYTKCEECGYEVDLINDEQASGGLVVTIDAIQAQDTNGANGYITLTFSYVTDDAVVVGAQTKTFNYYTSSTAYNGRVDKDTAYDPDLTSKNGLCLDDDGTYRYYVNDTVSTAFTGITEYNGGYFVVVNGVLATSVNGLYNIGSTWYYVANGQVQTQYTGLVLYDGSWFYVTSGILDSTKNGLVYYEAAGETYLVADGQLLTGYNGLWFNSSDIGGDDQFYFIAAGQVQTYTGVVMYDGEFFLVEDGVLSDYTGTYEYDGATFNVVDGQFYDQVA